MNDDSTDAELARLLAVCPYCAGPVVPGKVSGRPVYTCAPCKAHVGLHRGTELPLGTVANAADRKLRGRAHLAFDRLWKLKIELHGVTKAEARGAGYRWLARETGIPVEFCHIAMMHGDQLKDVIHLCSKYGRRGY